MLNKKKQKTLSKFEGQTNPNNISEITLVCFVIRKPTGSILTETFDATNKG